MFIQLSGEKSRTFPGLSWSENIIFQCIFTSVCLPSYDNQGLRLCHESILLRFWKSEDLSWLIFHEFPEQFLKSKEGLSIVKKSSFWNSRTFRDFHDPCMVPNVLFAKLYMYTFSNRSKKQEVLCDIDHAAHSWCLICNLQAALKWECVLWEYGLSDVRSYTDIYF